jgi:hypothetical protein
MQPSISPNQTGTAIDQFFADERVTLRARLNNEPQFAPFRDLPDTMLTFLCGEKMRLSMTSESRDVLDSNGKSLTGITHHYNCSDDQFHPKHFEPFNIKGYWIPESEGQLFTADETSSCPLVRNGPSGKEILFLVHPKSESLFAPLMEKYAEQKVDITALSLSSFRSLLIALPGPTPQYTMVKVSLDEEIGGAPRILSLKECAGSIGTSAVLQQKPSKIAFVKEDTSFVPNTSLLNFASSNAQVKGAGMIYRAIPDCLSGQQYVIPLFALCGTNNRPLLEALIQQSNKTPTQFVKDFLLTPLADALVDLIYRQHVSIEAHGQNLLIAIDTSNPDDVKINFVYRDMGGVNCLFSDKDREAMPKSTNNDDFYFLKSHFADTANVIEDISKKILFNLTKQFFKSETYGHSDPEFAAWKSAMIRMGFAGNWSIPNENPDAHQQNFTVNDFYRYGYFDKMFGNALLDALTRQGIFVELTDIDRKLSRRNFAEKLEHPGNPYNSCIEIEWFKDLILQTYPALSSS